MYYLLKDIMGSKLVYIGQYVNEGDAVKRKDHEDQNKYSFETYYVVDFKGYEELTANYVYQGVIMGMASNVRLDVQKWK